MLICHWFDTYLPCKEILTILIISWEGSKQVLVGKPDSENCFLDHYPLLKQHVRPKLRVMAPLSICICKRVPKRALLLQEINCNLKYKYFSGHRLSCTTLKLSTLGQLVSAYIPKLATTSMCFTVSLLAHNLTRQGHQLVTVRHRNGQSGCSLIIHKQVNKSILRNTLK